LIGLVKGFKTLTNILSNILINNNRSKMFSPNFVLFITITLSVLFSDSLNAYIKPKTSISGDVKFLDDLVTNFFPLGDKYGGLPENVISMGRYCA
jgi:hypothetical protein